MTQKLYETDGCLAEFDAYVLACERCGDGFAVELDQTAFFPEGGGQLADTGVLNEAVVSDVQIKQGRIWHYISCELAIGDKVHGRIDWEQRLRRMQNHTGEHIVSGTAHALFGCNNIGFHMGSEDVTIDFDCELSAEDIRKIERIANERVAQNREVRTYYPDRDALAALEYRSKKEIYGAVRIVEIDGVDRCACCAPHLSYTGAVGGIKLLDYLRNKGGTRIHMLCGLDALDDYNVKYENVCRISALLSAKQHETARAVERINDELCECRREIGLLRRKMAEMLAAGVETTHGNITMFVENFGADELRALANGLSEKCTVCAVFSGSDEIGYNYMVCSRRAGLRAFSKSINAAINGRGGGSDELLQGRCTASQTDIKEYFSGTEFI